MTQKKCFKCEEFKCLTEFYKHKQMKDGHLNKCKQCAKRDVSGHRSENIERIREYDRNRGARRTSEQTKAWREKYPNKYRAHGIVQRAVRSGRLFQEDCSECGSSESIHAHHDDYLKPLNVRWLCAACHHQWHAKNGQALNAT